MNKPINNTIIDLDAHRPHLAGLAVCRGCGEEHGYVAPLLMTVGDWLHMECHKCGKMVCHDKNFNVEHNL